MKERERESERMSCPRDGEYEIDQYYMLMSVESLIYTKMSREEEDCTMYINVIKKIIISSTLFKNTCIL